MLVYTCMLAVTWPLAALNRFDVWTPDDRLVPISLVMLNAIVWAVALTEVVGWFMDADDETTLCVNAHRMSVWVLRCAVVVLMLCAFSNESARYAAFLLVAICVGVLLRVVVVYATEARRISVPFDWKGVVASFRQGTRPHAVVSTLVVLGIMTIVFELLSPSYGNVVGQGLVAIFMLMEHVGLGAVVLCMATDTYVEPPRQSSPVITTESLNLSNIDQPDAFLAGFDRQRGEV